MSRKFVKYDTVTGEKILAPIEETDLEGLDVGGMPDGTEGQTLRFNVDDEIEANSGIYNTDAYKRMYRNMTYMGYNPETGMFDLEHAAGKYVRIRKKTFGAWWNGLRY